MKKWLVVALLLMASLVYGGSTQQYNKIYFSPFYLDTLPNNINTTFVLYLDTPDKIAEVKTAIVVFSLHSSGQTVNYTLWVNNQSCNTPYYFVSTTYASSGQKQLFYDCSNVIRKEGIYNITIRPSGANSGSVNGWLEITYMNRPEQSIIVQGTEYTIGQNGTIFLQVENYNNTRCELDIYYPNKTIMVDTIMTYLNGSRGIYYYDFIVPSIEGVYITDALCYKPVSNTSVRSFYGFNTPLYVVKGQLEGASNYVNFGSISTGVEVCQMFFDTPASYGNLTFSEIGTIYEHRVWLYATASRSAQVRARYYAFNDKTNTYVLAGQSAGVNYTITSTTTQFVIPSVTIPYNLTTNEKLISEVCIKNNAGAVEFRMYYGGTTNSSFARNTTAVNLSEAFIYRGTGEIHINPLVINNTLISQNVWSYFNRTLTEYNSSNIPLNVWNYFNRTLTEYNSSSIPFSVWNYFNRTLTEYNNSNIPFNVWNYFNRTLTDYNSSSIPFNVWSYFNRTLTDYNNSNTPFNVWNYFNRTLTDYNSSSISFSVWNYFNRTLTDYNNSDIPFSVWNYFNRTLTEYNDSLVPFNVWNYFNRTLTDYNNSNIPFYVWNFGYRTLTNYNNSNIPFLVWSYPSRTLTDYNFSNLTEINLSVDIEKITSGVWEKFFFFGTPETIKPIKSSVCVSNNTLRRDIIFANNYSRSEYIDCPDGCSSGNCNPAPIVRAGLLSGIFVLILLFLIFLRRVF